MAAYAVVGALVAKSVGSWPSRNGVKKVISATSPVTNPTATHSRRLPRVERRARSRRLLGRGGRTGRNSMALRSTRAARSSSTLCASPSLSMRTQPRRHTSALGSMVLDCSCVSWTYLGVPSRRCQPASSVMGRGRASATPAIAFAGSRPLSTSSAARSTAWSVTVKPLARAVITAAKSCSDCVLSASTGGRSLAPTAVVRRSTPLWIAAPARWSTACLSSAAARSSRCSRPSTADTVSRPQTLSASRHSPGVSGVGASTMRQRRPARSQVPCGRGIGGEVESSTASSMPHK